MGEGGTSFGESSISPSSAIWTCFLGVAIFLGAAAFLGAINLTTFLVGLGLISGVGSALS